MPFGWYVPDYLNISHAIFIVLIVKLIDLLYFIYIVQIDNSIIGKYSSIKASLNNKCNECMPARFLKAPKTILKIFHTIKLIQTVINHKQTQQ